MPTNTTTPAAWDDPEYDVLGDLAAAHNAAWGTYKEPPPRKIDFESFRADTMRNIVALVKDAHAGQKDKIGRPYTEHLFAVRKGVQVLGGSKHAEAAALLHDVVEDTSWTIQRLRNAGAPEPVLVAVEAVTKRPSEEQGKYLARIIAAGVDAMHVKLADLLHNTRHDRLAQVPAHTRDRLLKKYRPSIARLMLELGLIVDEVEQKKLATKPAGTAGGYGSTYTGSYAIDTLYAGEWPKTWAAPIAARSKVQGGIVFALCDGSAKFFTTKQSRAKVKITSLSSWKANPQRAEWLEMYDFAKNPESAQQLIEDAMDDLGR